MTPERLRPHLEAWLEHGGLGRVHVVHLDGPWSGAEQLLIGDQYVDIHVCPSELAVREELTRLRTGGLRIGLTVTGPDQAATIERALAVGGFDAVQATWNLHERAAEPALARAHEAGLVVYVKEALANGRLTARGADPALAAAAREQGAGEDALALAAALARPWADIVLSGAATVAQLQSNLAARDVAWDDELERRLAGLVEAPADYWAARAALPWN